MAALFLAVFIDMVGFGIILPLLPFYAQHFGASPELVTLLAAAYTLTQFLFGPVWGGLSDRWGRRPVLLVTLAGTAVFYLWSAFAGSLAMLFAARACGGAMAANNAVANAYVADISTPETRAKAMGRMGAAFGLGFVTGPALGGLLAGPDPLDPDLRLPFLVAAGLSAVALAMALATLRESVAAETRARAAAAPRKNRLALFREYLARPQFGLLVGLMFVTPFVFSGMESVFALWTERSFGWGPEQNGYLYTFMGVVAVATQALAIGPLTAALGERRLLPLAAVVVGIGMLWLPFASDYAALMAAIAAIVFGVSVSHPCLNSLISQLAETHERGTLLGVAQMSSAFGRILGPALAGVGFTRLGIDWPYLLGALAMAVMAALCLRIPRPRPVARADKT